jgi:hypothetical protein
MRLRRLCTPMREKALGREPSSGPPRPGGWRGRHREEGMRSKLGIVGGLAALGLVVAGAAPWATPAAVAFDDPPVAAPQLELPPSPRKVSNIAIRVSVEDLGEHCPGRDLLPLGRAAVRLQGLCLQSRRVRISGSLPRQRSLYRAAAVPGRHPRVPRRSGIIGADGCRMCLRERELLRVHLPQCEPGAG